MTASMTATMMRLIEDDIERSCVCKLSGLTFVDVE